MADKTPLKANFTGTDVTSLGEFAAGDTVPVASGGTGATTAADARTSLGAAALAGSASQSFSMLNGTVAGALKVSGNVGIGVNTPGLPLDIYAPPSDTLGAGSFGISYSAGDGPVWSQRLNATTFHWNLDRQKSGVWYNALTIGRDNGAVTIPGTLSLTGASSTLGYGTGAGGTVTQATSKSTTVTLNKASGQITMNNEALAAGVTVSFIVNNTLVASSDLILISSLWNATGGPHVYSVTASAYEVNGTFLVAVKNLTGASRSDDVILSFVIIKGTTS